MRPSCLLLALLLAPAAAQAQAPSAAECPDAADAGQRELLGLWRAQVEGPVPSATLLLEPHPEYAEGVRGAVNRNGQRAQVAGDVEGGEFTLEESEDGVRISATWLGDVVPGSCGREIRGIWQAEGRTEVHPFVLRKTP